VRRIAVLAVVVCGAIAVGSSLAANPSSLRLVRVVGGLERPIYATQAPGEPKRLYVVEQPGRIRVVENGRLRAAPFLNLGAQVESGGNEQGLLGLAFSPAYARNGTFYVNYSLRGDGDTIVARYRARNGRVVAGSGRTILRVDQPYSNHNGGNLAFAPDGQLWVGLGDGGSGGDPENRAQNMDTLLGKMVRLDVRRTQPQPEIVALGLRNPWRYSFDRATGVLWIGDVGQNNLEEIDRLVRPGTGLVNFGWDVYEGNARFENKDLGPGRLVQPVAQYGRGAGRRSRGSPGATCSATTAAGRSGRCRRPAAPCASSRSASRASRRSVRASAASSTRSRTRAPCTASRADSSREAGFRRSGILPLIPACGGAHP
jgi:glucose/arabinose dehydrogenase